jgi:hypothetical protein
MSKENDNRSQKTIFETLFPSREILLQNSPYPFTFHNRSKVLPSDENLRNAHPLFGRKRVINFGGTTENSHIDKAQYFAQVILNSLQRQVANNLGFLFTSGKKVAITPNLLLGGFESRLAYNFFAIGPALLLRNYLDENNHNKIATSLLVAGVETTIGVPMEVYGSKNLLKTLGIEFDIKQLPRNSARIFVPALARNSLSWLAVGATPQDTTFPAKIGIAAALNALSTPLQNTCNIILENSALSNKELIKEVINKFAEDPKLLFRGASIRAISGIAATFILSKETAVFLKEEITNLATSIENHIEEQKLVCQQKEILQSYCNFMKSVVQNIQIPKPKSTMEPKTDQTSRPSKDSKGSTKGAAK